ncbi:hypothetical protein ACL1GI_04640 [Corynebacterium striatum]
MSDIFFGSSVIENVFSLGFDDLFAVVAPLLNIAEGASKLVGMFV